MAGKMKRPRPKILAKKIGEEIRRRRRAAGIPQDELAWRVKTHRAYMGAIERGEQNITVFMLCKICAALEIHPSDLLKDLGI